MPKPANKKIVFHLMTYMAVAVVAAAAALFIDAKVLRGTESGITIFSHPDRELTDDLLLYAPFSHPLPKEGPHVYLMDLKGQIRKSWVLPERPISTKIKDGYLYAMLLTPFKDKKTALLGEVYDIIRIDLQGRSEVILSGAKNSEVYSHDFGFFEEDKIATFRIEETDRSKYKFLKDPPPADAGKPSWSDAVVVYDQKGKLIWEWRVLDHLSEIQLNEIQYKSTSITHGNSVRYIESNPVTDKPAVLLSYRHLDLVILVEYPSGKVLWQNPPGSTFGQHDATYADGKVLVYNNNIFADNSVEIKEWDLARNRESLYVYFLYLNSGMMGGVRYLSNGNLLVSNSALGQMLEMDRKGKIIWSYLLEFNHDPKMLFWPTGTLFYRAEVYPESILETLK